MLKRRIFYGGMSICCGGSHGEVKQSHESQYNQQTAYYAGLYAAEQPLECPPIAIV